MNLQSSERREEGPALVGSRAREGEAGVSVWCVWFCGEVVHPSKARKRHSCTRAYSRRGHALTRLLSPAARPGRPACARQGKLFRAGASAGAMLLRQARALLPFPSEVPLGCGWGGCGRGFVSLAHRTSLILLWLLELEEERSRGVARLGVSGETRAPLPREHSRALANTLPQTHTLKLPQLRFAFAFKMARESLRVRPSMLQSPGLSFAPNHPYPHLSTSLLPSQSLGSVDPRHHLDFLSISEHRHPSTKLARVLTPVPCGLHPTHSDVF